MNIAPRERESIHLTIILSHTYGTLLHFIVRLLLVITEDLSVHNSVQCETKSTCVLWKEMYKEVSLVINNLICYKIEF